MANEDQKEKKVRDDLGQKSSSLDNDDSIQPIENDHVKYTGTIQKLSEDECFVEIPIEILASAGIKSDGLININIKDKKLVIRAVNKVSKREALDSFVTLNEKNN